MCIGGWTEASAQNRCLVADPTGTPLNVRTAPDGPTVGTLTNGTLVAIFDRSFVGGKPWVYVGRYEDRVPIGWVYRNYLNCEDTTALQPSSYAVDGLALGGKVHPETEAYKQYRCGPSEAFPGFTWCHKEKKEKTKRGEVTSSTSILHSEDGTAVYVNRYLEPAFFRPHDVRGELDRLSAKFREQPREFWMPPREGSPNAVIAVWGKIKLEQLDAAEVSLWASGKSHQGLLISYLGSIERSAKAGVPVYRIAGGPGYLWAATFDREGRGALRFLTVDASRITAPQTEPPRPKEPQPPPLPPSRPHEVETASARIGEWSITHEEVSNSSVCSATAPFVDQTVLQFAFIQSDTGKGWTLAISNPRWNVWVAQKPQHELWLVTTESRRATFDVADDKKTLTLGASNDFMNSLGDAHLLRILSDNKQSLAFLDMRDIDTAIKGVANCVQEHPPSRPRPPEPESPKIFGTAFFVAPNLLLTNNHVVAECGGPIQVRYPDRPSYSANVHFSDEKNDLALLDTQMSSLSLASFHSGLKVGDPVSAYGFPYPELLSPNFTTGNVTSLIGMGRDTRFLQMSTPIQPGNSGGPLLDASGNVVGVVVSQLDALAVMQVSKSVPQNVNFAIQVSIMLTFLSAEEVAYKIDTANAGRTLPLPNVAELAKQFTVQVSCEGIAPKTSKAGQQPGGANLTGGHR